MALNVGSRLGHYDVTALIGEGGMGPEELLLGDSGFPMDWSSDGRFLLYRTGRDLLALPLEGDPAPIVVATSNFDESGGQFSPDGTWVAYESDESGRVEVYIQPFPGPGEKVQVSTGGGRQVRWRGDGNELFYVAFDDRLMAVPLRFRSAGQMAEADSPVPLFATHFGGENLGLSIQQYVVSSDGQRFLTNAVVGETNPPITVILNWQPE